MLFPGKILPARFDAAGVQQSWRCDRRSAFTLLEVMFAAAVMTLAITTSITAMQRAFVALDSARNITIAGQILQNEMEKMRLKDWATVDAYPAGPTALTIDTNFTSNAVIGNRFALSRTVTTVRSGMKELRYTVTWTSLDRRTLTHTYFTYYGQYGMYDYYYNAA
ncbi:MAG: hypothetical protein HY302_16305 [Opitutae bacterium]|nr:hypothetical protein [Opitutae bacterium]